jgi:hypothetical protein
MNTPFIYLAIFVLLGVFSCSQKKSEDKAVEIASPIKTTDTLSELEREHLLFRQTYADSVNAGILSDTFKGSARREAKGTIGDAKITINYGSPGVRGRVIWNGLVSYDQVWVSGSHWATAIHFSKEVRIENHSVPPGWYGFFTIPGREKWTLILNKNYDQHLAEEYKQEEDLFRLKVNPTVLKDTVQRLTYEIEDLEGNEGVISLSWAKVRLELPVKDI